MVLGLLAAVGALTPPVSATWQSLQSGGPQTVSAGTLEPPTGTAACVQLLPTRVRVTWTATPSSFADGYEVLRSTTDGGPYASVGTVGGQATTTFTDTTATSLTTYYYRGAGDQAPVAQRRLRAGIGDRPAVALHELSRTRRGRFMKTWVGSPAGKRS